MYIYIYVCVCVCVMQLPRKRWSTIQQKTIIKKSTTKKWANKQIKIQSSGLFLTTIPFSTQFATHVLSIRIDDKHAGVRLAFHKQQIGYISIWTPLLSVQRCWPSAACQYLMGVNWDVATANLFCAWYIYSYFAIYTTRKSVRSVMTPSITAFILLILSTALSVSPYVLTNAVNIILMGMSHIVNFDYW